jgi:hypothetical protein
MSPQQIIERNLAGYLVTGKSYHSPLPKELAEWYCYTSDGGHSILCLLEGHFETDSGPLDQYLCPVPVKTVLRAGWKPQPGESGLTYIVTQVAYSREIGLITEAADDEF